MAFPVCWWGRAVSCQRLRQVVSFVNIRPLVALFYLQAITRVDRVKTLVSNIMLPMVGRHRRKSPMRCINKAKKFRSIFWLNQKMSIWIHWGSQQRGDTQIEIIDPVVDYANLMESIFDFPAMSSLFAGGEFRMCFDAMHAVTGPYAREISGKPTGCPQGNCHQCNPAHGFWWRSSGPESGPCTRTCVPLKGCTMHSILVRLQMETVTEIWCWVRIVILIPVTAWQF